ncbi:MAG: type II toxin-antitoxin system VapB family antitoxin [Hyphomicrobiaceae bacterium]
MVFYIKDPATDRAVRRLSKATGKSLTEAVKEAVVEKLARVEKEQTDVPMSQRLEALAREFAKIPKSGKKADKAFYDWLSGEEDDVR